MPREFLVVSDSYWYKVSVKRKMKTIANIANPANRWVLMKKQQFSPFYSWNNKYRHLCKKKNHVRQHHIARAQYITLMFY